MISIPSIGILFLQNKRIQTYLTSLVAEKIATQLDAKITVDAVSLTFINRLQLKNLYVEDQNGDTLFFAHKLKLSLRNYSKKKKEIIISKLSIEDSYTHFIVDTAGVLNVRFIIDALKNKDTADSSKFNVKINTIDMSGSRFHYSRQGRLAVKSGFDPSNMDMRELKFSLENFDIRGDTIAFSINEMSFVEKSGLAVDEFTANMNLSLTHMDFNLLDLKTPFSQISAEYLKLDFFSYEDFSDFINLVGIRFNFKPSLLSFNDISFFSPTLKGYDEEFRFSGLLSGNISNLKGNSLLLTYKNDTRLKANFTMIGLPNIKSAFMNYDFTSLETNVSDLKSIKIPGGDNNDHLNLPEIFNELGTIKYSGKFTGYIDDFVAYGKFSTNLGELSSDILLKPDTASSLYFQGILKTKDFLLGKLIKQDSLVGRISMNAKINGHSSKKSLYAKMDGLIDSLEFNQYNYKNIDLEGTLTNKIFDGSFSISDPNIMMEFLGKLNFTKESPEFTFTADVSRARPYYLHLDNTDPGYFASFLLETNFKGLKLDQVNGEIRIINSLFRKNDVQLQMYNFNLLAINNPDTNRILINSDVIDAEVNGHYLFSTLTTSFKNLAGYYLPALRENNGQEIQNEDQNSFSFNATLKNVHPLIAFFLPEYDLGNNTVISGHYFPESKDVELNIDANSFTFRGNELQNLKLKARSDQKTVNLLSTSTALLMKNKMKLDNLVLNSVLRKDTAIIAFDWNSDGKPLYKGNINAIADLKRNSITNNPVIGIHIDPSDIFFNDTLWHISESSLVVDSSSIAIDSFNINNQDQKLLVYGILSENQEDALFFGFEDMDMNVLNMFSKKYKITLAGNLSGQASIKDPFNNLTFQSDLRMDDLIVNDEILQKGGINANWNSTHKKIHINSFIGGGLMPVLKIEGDFIPQTKTLDFDITLDKLKVNIFHPWADFLVSDMKGIANGNLKLQGSAKKPDLNGSIRLMKTSCVVNYLQTRYNFSNDVKIVHNNFILNDFEAFDEKGNKAVAQGNITSKYFKEYALDIRVETNNFEFLNTVEKDNPLFYGRIYAGGIIRINGPTDNLQMNITARSERNSIFFIPLYATEEVAVSNFVDWVNPEEIHSGNGQTEPRYEVKMKGIQMDFNLEVTPDAEVQLIFDPKIGDIIKGRGTGNLKIMINTLGKFEIYGDMSIEEGEYLFTLKNVINKKFVVEKGGRLSWNGDPADANIDLIAVYGLKTTISALDPTADQQTSRKRIPVECIINMSGKLMNPTIKPDITLPGADQQTQNIVKNSINTDEELMKQFVSLLVMNNFYSQQGFTQGGGGASTKMAGVTTTTELLSNQLSSWFSQISNDFDIGVNYRPGDLITSEELQVALSTQILNDRISISGNLDVGGTETGTSSATNTNNIVGDFDINFKITEKLHVKAFNRSNDNLLFQTSPYTQGVGFFYREYFNNLHDLVSKLKKTESEKSKGKKPEEEDL